MKLDCFNIFYNFAIISEIYSIFNLFCRTIALFEYIFIYLLRGGKIFPFFISEIMFYASESNPPTLYVSMIFFLNIFFFPFFDILFLDIYRALHIV